VSLAEAVEQVIRKSRWHITNDDTGSSHLADWVEVPVEDWLAMSNVLVDEKQRDAEAVKPGLRDLRAAIWGEEQR
jgi:hypothetical protein